MLINFHKARSLLGNCRYTEAFLFKKYFCRSLYFQILTYDSLRRGQTRQNRSKVILVKLKWEGKKVTVKFQISCFQVSRSQVICASYRESLFCRIYDRILISFQTLCFIRFPRILGIKVRMLMIDFEVFLSLAIS